MGKVVELVHPDQKLISLVGCPHTTTILLELVSDLSNVAAIPKSSHLGVQSTQVAQLNSTFRVESNWINSSRLQVNLVGEVEGAFFLIATVGCKIM
jgi:hypothetical protein